VSTRFLLATKYASPVIQAKCVGMASLKPVKFTFGRGLGLYNAFYPFHEFQKYTNHEQGPRHYL